MNIRVIGISIASMCIGAGIGYMIAEKRMLKTFDERLEREVADMREFYTTVVTKKYPTPEEAVADLIKPEKNVPVITTAEKVAYHKIVATEYNNGVPWEEVELEIQDERTEQRNVFADQEVEIAVISQEAFMQNDSGYTQATLTYYAEDHIVTDEQEDELSDHEKIVGPNIEDKFGEQSSDPLTVHVRNDKLRMEFEIVRHPSAYSREVLGITEAPVKTVRERLREEAD